MKTSNAQKDENEVIAPAPDATTERATAEIIAAPIRSGAPVAIRLIRFFQLIGFGWGVPLVRLCVREDPPEQIRQLLLLAGVPVMAFIAFLVMWDWSAGKVETSLGAIPGPAAVWREAGNLIDDHYREREKEREFYQRQEERNARKLAQDPGAEVRIRPYTGKPTYPAQILTSLKTVFMGFVLAAIIAVPLGIVCGLSRIVNTALNPLIQILKPVSPLAWLPIVTLVVSATYEVTDDSVFDKAFLISAITVTLCSIWPALINTAVGVATIDRDLLNVAKVLQLGWLRTVVKIVLPSSLPLIFTGLRLSLGVGWMVLIAAEMLAQNPGLGKFVWDEFQNGGSASLGRIMVAVLTIGCIGFLLDRIMLTLQKVFSFGEAV
jgi:nitrate/nitrite transport system permease protein